MTGDAGLAVQTDGLTKRFGQQVAVDAIGLAVPSGAVYGFLGPNGSGKTTTIRMLLGLVEPTTGTRSLLGLPMPERSGEALHRVGSLVEGPAFHPYLSGRANLARLDAADVRRSPHRWASHRRRARPGGSAGRGEEALPRLLPRDAAAPRHRRCPARAARPARPRRADQRPRPQGTREVRTLIGSLASDGTTVLVSSHLLAEVEQICSHLGVMREGRLVAQGTVGEVRGGGPAVVRVRTRQPEAAASVLTALGVEQVRTTGGEVHGIPGELEPEKIVATLVHAGVGVQGFSVSTASLEDLFVALTGEGFDVSG